LSALFFYGVMSSGFLELISGDKILFKTYVLSCFGLLSLMCCFFFMVSRYKTPFLFLVIILAGNSLIYFKQNLRRLRLENLFRKTIYLSLFLFISLLYGNSIINRLFN
jgi:polyferredoxin